MGEEQKAWMNLRHQAVNTCLLADDVVATFERGGQDLYDRDSLIERLNVASQRLRLMLIELAQ